MMRIAPAWPCSSSPRATAASFRCWRCEDELLAVAGQVEIVYFSKPPAASSRPIRRRAGRRIDHHARRRRADSPDPPRSQVPGDDRRLRHRRRHSGLAELGRLRRVPAGRLRLARSTSTRWPRRRRSPITCRSTSSCAAARSTSISCSKCSVAAGRAPAADSGAQRLSRLQAARHRVRDGRPGHALPGPGHASRLRRDLSGLRPRLLRLLWPGRAAEPGQPDRPVHDRSACRASSWSRSLRDSFNGYAPEFRAESDRLRVRDRLTASDGSMSERPHDSRRGA